MFNFDRYIWFVDDSKRKPLILSGHSLEMTGCCFSSTEYGIATCGDDASIRLWSTIDYGLEFDPKRGSLVVA